MWRRWFCFSSWLVVRLLTAESRASAEALGMTATVADGDPGDLVSVDLALSASEPLSALRMDLLVPDVLMSDPEAAVVIGEAPFVSFFRAAADTLRVVAVDSTGLSASNELRVHIDLRAGSDVGSGLVRIIESEAVTVSDRSVIRGVPVELPVVISSNVLAIGNGAGLQGETVSVTVSLSTEAPLAGIQISWGSDDLHVHGAGPVNRATHLPLYLSDGRILLLTDPTGQTSLPAGSTDVLALEVGIPRNQPTGPYILRPTEVVATGLDGSRVMIRAIPGSFDVHRRPNEPPALTLPDTLHFMEDEETRWTIPGQDPDGDPLDYHLEDSPGWLRISGNVLLGSAEDVDVGPHRVVIRVSDGLVEVADTLTLSVANVAPRIPTQEQTVRVGKPLVFEVTIHNLDGGDIAFDGQNGMSFEGKTVRWTPGAIGRFLLRVTAVDPHGMIGMGDVWVRVEPRPAVKIAEVLADPPEGASGDTNGDGIRETNGDEYVEIVNEGRTPVTIGGWVLADDDTRLDASFRFPGGTVLIPGERVVVYGRPPGPSVPHLAFGDDGKIGNGLANRSEKVLLLDPIYDDTVDVFAYTLDKSPKASLVRTSRGIERHDAFPGYEKMSPGEPRAVAAALDLIVPGQLTLGDRDTAVARVVYSDGHVTSIEEEVSWIAGGPGLHLGPEGLLRALRPGTFRIFALWHGYVATADVSVVGPPPLPPMHLESDPPEEARVGAWFRYTPRISDDEGAEIRFTVEGRDVQREGGTFWWRPKEPGPVTMRLRAIREDGDTLTHTTQRVVEPRPDLILSEILADPLPGSAGDANRDGVRESLGDEFLEIVNRSSFPVSLEGWVLKDDDVALTETPPLPARFLDPGDFLILFVSDRPSGRLGNGLSNAGDRLLLIDTTFGDTLIDVTYRVVGDLNRSVVPSVNGWVPHEGPPFSPGWIETPEETDAASEEHESEGLASLPDRGALRVEEVLSDPPAGPMGDANRDGISLNHA